jgi:UDP-GlcNAc:undecaprenyl-phosphate GlcNAc-1-phosphate transferase
MTMGLFYLVLGFVLVVITTPWIIRMAHSGVGLDVADEARKQQSAPVPRLGGMPVMLALVVALIIILWRQPARSAEWFPILAGAVLMYSLGLWDDVSRLGAKKKLLGQIVTATLVWSLGLSIERFSLPGYGRIELGIMSAPVTIFWLIAIPNIVNLIDGFDGLAGGLGVFMALTLGIVGHETQHYAVASFAFAMAGALLGFLVFNFPPAKIYLGDGGAYLIGFLLAALSLATSHKGSVAAVLLVMVVGLGLPILDTLFALARRAARGFPLFHADSEHFHHRLQEFGFSKRRILFGLYGICVVLSLIGLTIFWNQGGTLTIAIGVGVMFLMALGVVRHFLRVNSFVDAHRKMKRMLGRRQMVQYALLQAKVLVLEADRCETGEEFWGIFEQTLRRVGFCEDGEVSDQVSVEMRHNGSRPWRLHAPGGDGTQAEWQRLAECFRPAYVKALERWGRP